MPSPIMTHAIAKEFPELADKIHALKASDHHFAKLLAEHDAVDAQITKSEEEVAPMGDAALEGLKKQRLHLKDALYHTLTAA